MQTLLAAHWQRHLKGFYVYNNMSTAILLAMGAMVTGGLADLIYKSVQNRGINSATFVFYQAITFTAVIWIIAVLFDQLSRIITATWLFGLPLGVLGYTGIVLFVSSLKEGNASVYAPLFRLSFIITAGIAFVVLGEPVTLAKILGILLAVVAVLSLANFKGFTSTGRSQLRSVLYLLGATLAFGIAGALNKEAINQGSPTIPLVIVQTITFTAASFIHMLATRRVRPNGTTLRFAPLVGILQLSWTALLFQSLQTGDASISFPIVQLSFVLTAILAVAFLREAVTRNLVIGLSAASLAVIAFALA